MGITFKGNTNIVEHDPGHSLRSSIEGYNILMASYDISWNWLMPVVEKIESLNNGSEDNEFDIFSNCVQLRANESADEFVDETKMKAVYKAVLFYIKNYTDGTKKQTFPRGYKQYQVLKEIDRRGGLTYTGIIKFAYELEGDRNFDPVKNRGYWSNAFMGKSSYPKYSKPGFITKFCDSKNLFDGIGFKKGYVLNPDGIKKLDELSQKFKDMLPLEAMEMKAKKDVVKPEFKDFADVVNDFVDESLNNSIYRLIKTYPGWNTLGAKVLKSDIPGIENYPEFWEEIKIKTVEEITVVKNISPLFYYMFQTSSWTYDNLSGKEKNILTEKEFEDIKTYFRRTDRPLIINIPK